MLPLILFNLATCAAYSVFEQGARPIRAVSAVLFLAFLASGVYSLKKKKAAELIVSFQLLAASVFLPLVISQAIFLLFPGIFPANLRNMVAHPWKDSPAKDYVEYLSANPYVKPAPDTLIRVPGDYGKSDAFVYQWRTDALGFKNLPAILKRPVDAVAVGDSFTEGMGVRTEDTWCSRLTGAGFATYSLGVQGYAPSQMTGAFELYGLRMRPKVVLIGYLSGVYEREAFFARKKEEILREKKFPSAIGRLVKHDENLRHEIRTRYRFLATALVYSAKAELAARAEYYRLQKDPQYADDPRFMSESRMKKDGKIRIGAMQRYFSEMFSEQRSLTTRAQLSSDPDWQRTAAAFSTMIKKADSIGAKTVIVFFRQRGDVYLKPATGRALPAAYRGNVEAALLKELAGSSGAFFLDTGEELERYMRGITDSTPVSSFPYLQYDGHFSRKGNELTAKMIYDFLADKKMLHRI